MSRKYDAKLFRDRVLNDTFKNAEELDFPNIFFAAINEGLTKRSQLMQIEYKRFDEDWLNNIETFFPSLLKITQNFRSSLKYEEEILPIEKTRRTNPESIRHLLRNTRYIRDVNQEGDIIPEKVLNTLSEIDYGIYENRFIMTLIDRLYNYLLRRIEVIKENVMGSKEMHFNYENDFDLETTNYNINLNIKSNEEIDIKEIDVHNYRIYENANEAFKIVSRIYHGQFMQIMKKYQKVKAPILKTQIILKNTDFKNAYLLWLYLDRLNALEFTLERKIKKVDFSKEYIEQIDKSLLMVFSTIFTNSDIDVNDKKVITENIKPKADDSEYTNNVSIEPVPYILEPNLATEYHLKKAKQLFSKQYSEITNNKDTPEQSLKQVLVDQYSIANQVFNYYFEVDQDADVFDRLINFANPIRKFDESLKKYIVSKTQREVLETIYLESLNLEAKWIRETKILQKEAIEFTIDRETKETNKTVEELNSTLDKELYLYDRKLVLSNKKALQDEKSKNRETISALTKKNSLELKNFREKEKQRVLKTKEKIKERKKIEREKIKAKQLKEKQRELLKLKKQREQDKEALRARLAKQKDDLRKKNNKTLENFKNK